MERKELRCFFSTAGSSWLRLGPMKTQVNSHDPYIINVKHLLYDHECDGITAALENKLDLSDIYETLAMNQIRKLYGKNECNVMYLHVIEFA